ncbi:hypothetical protein V6N11_021667 [Hibiscus sabdariffa]|uniref:Uncharacterized protein n=1 Tax=Hibiscus sabdariffa TaxID=183260 RepID=A0ABR1ZRD8_9ROSI
MPRSSRGRSYLYQWKLFSDLRRTRKQRKEGPPEGGPQTRNNCERVTGNGWAQESSQHSVESGVDLLVPYREREVI